MSGHYTALEKRLFAENNRLRAETELLSFAARAAADVLNDLFDYRRRRSSSFGSTTTAEANHLAAALTPALTCAVRRRAAQRAWAIVVHDARGAKWEAFLTDEALAHDEAREIILAEVVECATRGLSEMIRSRIRKRLVGAANEEPAP